MILYSAEKWLNYYYWFTYAASFLLQVSSVPFVLLEKVSCIESVVWSARIIFSHKTLPRALFITVGYNNFKISAYSFLMIADFNNEIDFRRLGFTKIVLVWVKNAELIYTFLINDYILFFKHSVIHSKTSLKKNAYFQSVLIRV